MGGLGIAEAVTHLLLRSSATSTALRSLGSLCRGHLLCELIMLSVICLLYGAVFLSAFAVAWLLSLVYVLRIPVLVGMTWWRG